MEINMTHINAITIALALLGVLIHTLLKYQNRSEKKKSFNFKYWIQDNWLNTTLAILCTLAILLMIDDVALFLGVTGDGSPLIKLIAFFSGYFNQSFMRGLTTTFKKKANIEDDNNQ